MPYKPTGNPPGRPPKTGPKPAPKPRPKPDVPAEPEKPAESRPEPVQAPSQGYEPLTYGICGACYPDGWPHNASGLACPHGIWTRRL